MPTPTSIYGNVTARTCTQGYQAYHTRMLYKRTHTHTHVCNTVLLTRVQTDTHTHTYMNVAVYSGATLLYYSSTYIHVCICQYARYVLIVIGQRCRVNLLKPLTINSWSTRVCVCVCVCPSVHHSIVQY